jgi:hypothetical protein
MKKYLINMLYPAIFILATPLVQPAFAADSATTSKAENSATIDMQILSQQVTADKKLVIMNNMNLTDAEAKAFWPVYEAYQKDLHQINLRLVKVLNDYSLAFNKGAVLEDTAKKLLAEDIAIELAEANLKKTYVPKLSKAIPAAKVARYIQIEKKIRAIVRYQLAESIPLAK